MEHYNGSLLIESFFHFLYAVLEHTNFKMASESSLKTYNSYKEVIQQKKWIDTKKQPKDKFHGGFCYKSST